MWYGGFAPYVSVGERKALAREYARKLEKKGHKVSPVVIEGRTIARSFWGKTWCDHMESFSDYENRLPRGARYVRNGSVFDLQIKPGKVEAHVSGSEIYKIDIRFKPLDKKRWKVIQDACSGQIASIVELLQGKFSDAVMRVLTDRDQGMFPSPKEIDFDCSCPDSAGMCKHIAAVLYGVGSRLDHQPELFFTLRQVNPLELIDAAGKRVAAAPAADAATTIAAADLSDVFGIEIDTSSAAAGSPPAPVPSKQAPKPAKGHPAKRKAAKPPVTAKTRQAQATAARGPKKPGPRKATTKPASQ